MSDADGIDEVKPRASRGRVGARASALRRAREAKQARDAERLARERAVESALADYYIAADAVDRTRERALQKAEEIVRQAETTAQDSLAQAEDALRRLRELGETRSWIKEVTGVSGSHLYGALATGSGANDGEGDRESGEGGDGSSGVEPRGRVTPGEDVGRHSVEPGAQTSRRHRPASEEVDRETSARGLIPDVRGLPNAGASEPAGETLDGSVDPDGESGRSPTT